MNETIYILSFFGALLGAAVAGFALGRMHGYLAGFVACSEIWKSHSHDLCEVCEDVDCPICSDDDDEILDAKEVR